MRFRVPTDLHTGRHSHHSSALAHVQGEPAAVQRGAAPKLARRDGSGGLENSSSLPA